MKPWRNDVVVDTNFGAACIPLCMSAVLRAQRRRRAVQYSAMNKIDIGKKTTTAIKISVCTNRGWKWAHYRRHTGIELYLPAPVAVLYSLLTRIGTFNGRKQAWAVQRITPTDGSDLIGPPNPTHKDLVLVTNVSDKTQSAIDWKWRWDCPSVIAVSPKR